MPGDVAYVVAALPGDRFCRSPALVATRHLSARDPGGGVRAIAQENDEDPEQSGRDQAAEDGGEVAEGMGFEPTIGVFPL